METQPKNPESVSLSLVQTSKGFWYVKTLSADGSNVEKMFKQLDILLKGTIKRLVDLNEEEYDE